MRNENREMKINKLATAMNTFSFVPQFNGLIAISVSCASHLQNHIFNKVCLYCCQSGQAVSLLSGSLEYANFFAASSGRDLRHIETTKRYAGKLTLIPTLEDARN
jgi:hypothetical protein